MPRRGQRISWRTRGSSHRRHGLCAERSSGQGQSNQWRWIRRSVMSSIQSCSDPERGCWILRHCNHWILYNLSATRLVLRINIRTPGIEVIAGSKHRKEEYNPRVSLQGYEQAEELRLPGWVADRVHASSIRSDHFVWVHHEQREKHANESQDQEADLMNHQFLLTIPDLITCICSIANCTQQNWSVPRWDNNIVSLTAVALTVENMSVHTFANVILHPPYC